MDYVLTFLEGIITFISPCLLPMLPLYIAYFSGGSTSDENSMAKTLINALAFVLGFTLVFTLLGAFAGSLGAHLVRHQAILNLFCGTVIVLLGLQYLDVIKLPSFNALRLQHAQVTPQSLGSSLLFGLIFGFAWTPCVGTFLGAALSLAASSGSTMHGIGLLVSYSLGLGIPFVVAALLIKRLEQGLSWIKTHYALVNRVSGTLLVALGIAMATGYLGAWVSALA